MPARLKSHSGARTVHTQHSGPTRTKSTTTVSWCSGKCRAAGSCERKEILRPMSSNVRMPAFALEADTSARVVRVLRRAGFSVDIGEPLIVVQIGAHAVL